MIYLNLFIIYLLKNIKKIIIQKINNVNLFRSLINQMVYYLPTKMTRQIVSYFVNKKKTTLVTMAGPNWEGGLFYACHFGYLLN